MPKTDTAQIIHLAPRDIPAYAGEQGSQRIGPRVAGTEPDQVESPLAAPPPPAPERRRVIGDVLADYIRERGAGIQSVVTFRMAIVNLVAFWGERPATDLSEASCHAYYAFRNRTRALSNATVGRELRVLRAAINRDFEMGRLDRKIKVWTKRERAKRTQPPTRRQVLRTARAAQPRSARRRYTLLGFYTGARKSAVLGLCWPQVSDTEIDFNPPGTAPTNKRRVVIPMHRKLRSFMRIWRQENAAGCEAVIHRNGKPVKGIKRAPKHLRAAAAVHMLQSGVNVYDIAKWLGNSVEMIERHYGHYSPDHFRKALAAWDGDRTSSRTLDISLKNVGPLP